MKYLGESLAIILLVAFCAAMFSPERFGTTAGMIVKAYNEAVK